MPALPVESLEDAVANSDWVLCGTSWQSDVEREAIGLARSSGKRVVAFLDHWSNYRERFTYRNELRLPDEVWVGDEHWLRLARAAFPSLPVVLVDNPHLTEVIDDIAAARTAHRPSGLGLHHVYDLRRVCVPHLVLALDTGQHGLQVLDAMRLADDPGVDGQR